MQIVTMADREISSRSTSMILAAPVAPAIICARAALRDPATFVGAVVALWIGATYFGALGVVLASALVLEAFAVATHSSYVRRQLERRAIDRARQHRERDRMTALEPAGSVVQFQYARLRDLVDQIERTDPAEGHRLELQDLLAAFVRVVIIHRRCVVAFELAGAKLDVTMPEVVAVRSARVEGIIARRVRHRDICKHRVEQLADEIATIDQLIRLIAQRVACPRQEDDLDGEIDRRLSEIDLIDAPVDQTSI